MNVGWIGVQEVSSQISVQLLQQVLDQGEAEAITLAIELKVDRILLDERDGRKIAKSLGLQVTGVLGILLRAKKEGELSSLPDAIDALVKTAGFRISPELLAKILAT